MSPRRKRAARAPDREGARTVAPDMLRLDGISPGHRKALWVVIAITGSMFAIETAAGHIYGSHVLQVDALDFLDDMLIYALSLAVIGASIRIRAAAAIFKATILCLMSLWILGSAIYHLFVLALPHAEVMGAAGLLGILANTACVRILAPYTDGSADVRPDDLDYQHELVGNIAVVVAAAAVWALQSPWPDLLIAITASGHFLFFALQMLRRAAGLYQTSGNVTRR